MNEVASQSTFEAALGSPAASINALAMVLYAGAAVILVLVSCLALLAVLSRPRYVDAKRWIIGGGLAFPVVTLAALFAYAFAIGHALEPRAAGDVLRVHVTGKQWWWEVRYEGNAGGGRDVVLANELHIPVGRPVHVVLTADDVIHSFWIPSLAGKVDMIPGYSNRLVLQTGEAGVFRGQCAEYCGAQHAQLAFYVVAEPQAGFEAWLDHQATPAQLPAEAGLAVGHDLFFRGGCAACHAIRGTAANGVLGPDLTHVGSRRSLGAGTLGNHAGTMAGWIAGTQDLKPASRMPNAESYTGPELRALSAWLGTLK
jgi:cytochrome c oxidase subunit II